MFYQSRNNPSAISVVFIETLLRIIANNFFDFIDCLKENNVPDMYSKKVKMEMVSDAVVSCILKIHHLFCNNAQSEIFTYIYQNFKPSIDYSSHCFKIVKRHYFDYIIRKFNS